MGGSGGGGGAFVHRKPSDLAKLVRKTEDNTAIRAFETVLNKFLGDKLAAANSRDIDKVSERLAEIKDILGDDLDGTVDTLFGGSVAKHTYVDGLSDIDSLLILDSKFIDSQKPSTLLNKIERLISGKMSNAEVTSGRLAVTVRYPDGMQLQLLPAARVDGQLRVPSFRRDGWSGISPEGFQKALTDTNERCNFKLVPTIKLAKAIIGTLPDDKRLSGYHVESLAIAAFKDYDGPKVASAMLPAFFERAKDLVKSPIKDSTGQSIHVDGYLGNAGSAERVAASHLLERIAKRMRNASAHQSAAQWEALFD
nr:CBASS oligonucleotide cyclase [Mesorhizobium sp.]